LQTSIGAAKGLTGTPTPGHRFHLSLHAIGNYGIAGSCDALAEWPRLHVHASAFAVAFDRTMTFATGQDAKPFVLCASDGMMALRSLHNQLGQALWRVASANMSRGASPTYHAAL
jgi:2'-5' RNA ligase